MPLATTLRLLAKARGMSVTDLATAIPRAGVDTVSAWLRGEKMPGKDQLDALARTLGVPAGALLAELASTLDPSRTQGEHDLLAAYRAMSTRQQGALLEIARGLAEPARAASPKGRRNERDQEEGLQGGARADAGRARRDGPLGAARRSNASSCCSKAATPPARAARSTRSANT